jgi:hypothetical protein
MKLLLIFFLVASLCQVDCAQNNVDYAAGTTVCVLSNGNKSTTNSDCTTGEVFLVGKYINLGIHNVASFGTASSFNSSYYTGRLGFIADYDRNGFNSTAPAYAGDYFVPGLPVEGSTLKSSPPHF